MRAEVDQRDLAGDHLYLDRDLRRAVSQRATHRRVRLGPFDQLLELLHGGALGPDLHFHSHVRQRRRDLAHAEQAARVGLAVHADLQPVDRNAQYGCPHRDRGRGARCHRGAQEPTRIGA